MTEQEYKNKKEELEAELLKTEQEWRTQNQPDFEKYVGKYYTYKNKKEKERLVGKVISYNMQKNEFYCVEVEMYEDAINYESIQSWNKNGFDKQFQIIEPEQSKTIFDNMIKDFSQLILQKFNL